MESCPSGLRCGSRKAVCRKAPWVRIPRSPPNLLKSERSSRAASFSPALFGVLSALSRADQKAAGHSAGCSAVFIQKSIRKAPSFRAVPFSGDLIYAGCLDAFYPTTDPLLFAQSVRRIRALPVRRVLPGHGSLSISPGLIEAVDRGFSILARQNALHHDAGFFSFEDFHIRL